MKCRAAIAALLLLLAAGGAHAATPRRLAIEHAYFQGFTYKPGAWHRLYARVVNGTGRDQRADVVLIVREGATRRTRYVYSALYPAGASRTIWFDAVPSGETEYTVELIRARGGRAARYRTLASPLGAGPKGRPAGGGGDTGAVSGSRFLLMRVDEGEVCPSVGHQLAYGGTTRQVSSTSLGTRDLPDHWAALDGVDALMLGKLDLGALRPMQIRALRSWVEMGGVLMIFPGNDWAAAGDSALADLLPVRLMGEREVRDVTIAGGGGRPLRVGLERGVRLWEAEAFEGEVLRTGGAYPMVVRRPMGSGQVLFFAFEGVALDGEQRAHALWSDLLRSEETVVLARQNVLGSQGAQILNRLAGVQVVSPAFVLITLGGYLVVSAAALIGFRLRGRMELAWAVILPVGILLSGLSLRAGRRQRREVGDSLTSLTLVQLRAGEPAGREGGLMGLHFARTASVALQASGPDAMITSGVPGEDVGGQIRLEAVRPSEPCRIDRRQGKAGTMAVYRLDAALELAGPIRASARFTEGGVALDVANESGLDLENCLLVSNQYGMALPDFEAGRPRTVPVGRGEVRKRGEFSARAVQRSLDQVRTGVVASLFGPQRALAPEPWLSRLWLVGWTGEGRLPVEMDFGGEGMPARRPQQMLAVEITPEVPPPGTRVRILPPFWRLEAGAARVLGLGRAGEPMSMSGSGDFTLAVHPHPALRRVKIDALELLLTVRAWAYQVSVEVRNARTGRWEEVLSVRRPDGTQSLQLENAERFYSARRGALELRLRIRPLIEREKTDKEQRALSWVLSDLSVAATAEAL
jgi:hypothetical protein